MRNKIKLLGGLFVLLSGPLAASKLTSTEAQLEQRAEAFFAGSQPGGVVMVKRGDEVLLRRAYGLADVENQAPMRPEAVFPIASMSKQFTALAVLKLVEAGKLKLDQTLSSIDPKLPAAIGAVRIQQLLTHTSGIKNISSIAESRAARRNEATAEALIGFFKDLPLEFVPGSQFSYSNSNYIMLTRVIELVSGQSYPDFMAQTVFQPLQMQQTRYGDHLALIPNRAHGYQHDRSGQLLNAEFISMSQPQGAGGLLSTVDDLAKWDAGLREGKLLKPELLAQAFNKVKLNDGSTQPYGFGWVISEVQGITSFEHGGFINGFNSQLLRVPERNILVTVLSNAEALYPADLSVELAAIALDRPYDKTPASNPDFKPWLGTYRFDQDITREILLIDGKLHSQRAGADPIALLPAADGRYYLGEGLDYLRFETRADGKATVTLHERLFGDSVGVR